MKPGNRVLGQTLETALNSKQLSMVLVAHPVIDEDAGPNVSGALIAQALNIESGFSEGLARLFLGKLYSERFSAVFHLARRQASPFSA